MFERWLTGSLFDPRPMQDGGPGSQGSGSVEVDGSRAGDETGSKFSRVAPEGPKYDEAAFSTFRTGLGDLGKDKSLDVIKDFNGLASSYINSQRMIGDSVRLPGKDLDGDDKKADREKFVNDLRKKLAEAKIISLPPETPDGYEIKQPDLGPGLKWNEAFEKSFRGASHKLGLTNDQAVGLATWYNERQKERMKAAVVKQEENAGKLKEDWGAGYDRKLALAQRAIDHAGEKLGMADDIKTALEQSGWGDDVGLVKLFSFVGEVLAEEGMIEGEVIGQVGPEGAKAKLREIMESPRSGDNAHPYWNYKHPGHQAAVEEVTRLNEIIHGSKSV